MGPVRVSGSRQCQSESEGVSGSSRGLRKSDYNDDKNKDIFNKTLYHQQYSILDLTHENSDENKISTL